MNTIYYGVLACCAFDANRKSMSLSGCNNPESLKDNTPEDCEAAAWMPLLAGLKAFMF